MNAVGCCGLQLSYTRFLGGRVNLLLQGRVAARQVTVRVPSDCARTEPERTSGLQCLLEIISMDSK